MEFLKKDAKRCPKCKNENLEETQDGLRKICHGCNTTYDLFELATTKK